jgi:hypothetical protein
MLNIKPNKQERDELAQTRGDDLGKGLPDSKGGQFGEFDETGTGTDLTLEWDSNDPDLHMHQIDLSQTNELAKSAVDKDETFYRYFREAGLPDA